jgi:cytochrome c oxidase cbb3-type subunit 1
MHPFYIIRALGGGLYLLGAVIMIYNLWRTIGGALASDEPLEESAVPSAALARA